MRRILVLALACLAVALPASALAAPPALEQLGAVDSRGESDRGSAPGGPTTKVVGGNTTTSASYPWQALLEIDRGIGTSLCGGTLIHPYIVLTAAHCVTNAFGELETGTEVLTWLGRTFLHSGGVANETFNLWVPNAYNPFSKAYDIAFVSLWDGSDLPRLQIAGPTERALWTPGRAAAITGWGTTSEGGSLSPVLKEAQVPIVDDPTCAQPLVNGFAFDPLTMVCAGPLGGGVDTCQGDSGGPLQSPIDGGGFRLTGVTNWGFGCARPNKPGVYARIASDPLARFIAEAIPFIEVEDEIPIAGVNVFGAGGRPPGCAVAEAQLAGATAAAATATAALAGPTRRMTKANKSVAAVNRVVKASKLAKRRDQPRAGVRLKRAYKKLKTVKRKRKASQRRLATARSTAAAADATLAAAGANKTAVCG